MVSSSTSTDRPDSAKKYDRQLRIWGAHGQAALESASICLLNCGPTGSETLKNLVLGGIARFTIVDAGKVQPSDLGNNFLLDAEGLGGSKAQHVTDLLKELNDSVRGSFVDETPDALLEHNPAFFKEFDLVVATQMREPALVRLDEVCREHRVKLLIARSYGLVGSLRVSLPEHRVIESKPDNSAIDLRLHAPWPELQQFADRLDLATADDVTHKHIPYAILLLKAASQWQSQHGSKLPQGSAQRSEFKRIIQSWQRSIDGVPIEEDNFHEALSHANHYWAPPGIPSEVMEILKDPATAVTASSDNFWAMAAGLQRFVEQEGNGSLPLEGSIPDMTATTALYLQLQRIYREQADADVKAVAQHVRKVLQLAGRDQHAISHTDIKTFCKHARYLRVVRYRALADEFGAAHSIALRQALCAEDSMANAGLYVLLRAVDRFHETHQRFPGSFDGGYEDDVPLLKATTNSLLAELGVTAANVADDLVGEMCRFGAAELHCVAAVMGGIASQEAIKLITKQFVPLAATLVYNAMASTTSLLKI